MRTHYPLAENTIDKNDIQQLIDWLQTNPRLTKGPLTLEFEQRWADWLGVPHATYVNSGSSANLIMYYTLLVSGRLKNKKVIVPSVAWATTVAPTIQLGFEPIMCEADWDTFGLDLNHLEQLLQEHDAATVTAVHVLGVPNDMERLLALKERFGFFLLEDTCASTGARYDGQYVGSFGDMSTFSYYFGHHLSTIEGGMVCTADHEFFEILKQVRSHGWSRDLSEETQAALVRKYNVSAFNVPFTFYVPGFNVRATDLQARIGLSQMDKIDHVLGRRIENHARYTARFADATRFHFQKNDRAEICSISFALVAESPEHRDQVAERLLAADVETRPLGGGNMSRQPFWSDRYGTTDFPIADRLHTCGFHLPNNPDLSLDDIDAISDIALGAG